MHYKQNNKESKTYVQGLRQFGNTLPRGVKGILKKNGYNYSEIISKWGKLVGKYLSDRSYPKSIKISKDGHKGILILGVQRGSEIDIEYSKKDIANKINSYFGYKLIKEIKLQTINYQFKKMKKNYQNKFSKDFNKKINEIKNKNIRNSLSSLLDAIKNA